MIAFLQDENVVLLVDGIRFLLRRSLLLSHPETMLGRMFDENTSRYRCYTVQLLYCILYRCYTVHCTLYSVQMLYILYDIHCILYSVYCIRIVYIVYTYSIICNARLTLCNVQCALYDVTGYYVLQQYNV